MGKAVRSDWLANPWLEFIDWNYVCNNSWLAKIEVRELMRDSIFCDYVKRKFKVNKTFRLKFKQYFPEYYQMLMPESIKNESHSRSR